MRSPTLIESGTIFVPVSWPRVPMASQKYCQSFAVLFSSRTPFCANAVEPMPTHSELPLECGQPKMSSGTLTVAL